MIIDNLIYKITTHLIKILTKLITKYLHPNYYEIYKIATTLGSFEWLNRLTNEQINELKKEVAVFDREVKRRNL